MSNSLEQLISEDLTNYGKGGQGYDWHNQQSGSKSSLIDIMTKHTGQDSNGRAGGVLPYEIQTISDRIVTQYENTGVLKSDFVSALKNPIVSDDEASKATIQRIIEEINDITKKYGKIMLELDKLTV
jgi:hypothetical protein|tara:strand:- start:45631 stop:46011 length:381 start_codon:yes stop_codon:yes gene_type:complete